MSNTKPRAKSAYETLKSVEVKGLIEKNSIVIDKLTSMDVNTAIQRSTAKAIAMHGIGLSLWTGEDLSIEAPKEVEEKKLVTLEVNTPNWEKVLAYVANNNTKTLAQIGKELAIKK